MSIVVRGCVQINNAVGEPLGRAVRPSQPPSDRQG